MFTLQFVFKFTAKPYITSSSPTQLHQLLGATVNLFCHAKGTPEPDVVWSKNGVPLVNSKRVTIALDKATVEIRDLQRSDSGTYTCTFTNSMGAVSQQIILIVEGWNFFFIFRQLYMRLFYCFTIISLLERVTPIILKIQTPLPIRMLCTSTVYETFLNCLIVNQRGVFHLILDITTYT